VQKIIFCTPQEKPDFLNTRKISFACLQNFPYLTTLPLQKIKVKQGKEKQETGIMPVQNTWHYACNIFSGVDSLHSAMCMRKEYL